MDDDAIIDALDDTFSRPILGSVCGLSGASCYVVTKVMGEFCVTAASKSYGTASKMFNPPLSCGFYASF